MPPSRRLSFITRPARGPFACRAIVVAGLAVSLAGCAAQTKPRGARVPVTVATAEARPMPYSLVSTGTVEPIQTAAVGSQVGGTVVRVAFREGDEVREGQTLFELDARPFRAALDQAQGALGRDRAQAEIARLDAERARKLFDQNLISQADWDQKRTTAEALAAAARADSAAAQTARLNLEYASIRAPITGRTGRLMVHEGDYVRPATVDPLVTINQTRPVRVRFTVPVSAVPLVQRYRNAHPRVIVTPAAGDSATMIEGPLVFVDNAVDPASGTLLLKGEFPNADGRLVSGEFVDVRLQLYVEPKAMVVPSQAVTNGQQGPFVYVMNADSTVTPQPVTVARTVDEWSVLAGGLTAGQTVITDGQLRLSPGAKVLVRAPGGTR